MPLDPDARVLIDRLSEGATPVERLAPDEARAASRARLAANSQPVPDDGLTVADRTIDVGDRAIGVRVYSPPGEGHPIVVFFHGGGWVLCDLDSHDGLCRTMAAASQAIVVSVDYRRAPEHPFPAALRDADAATRWVLRHGTELGGDTTRVAVAGDSAGANLATVAARHIGTAGGVCFQLLIYPITDRSCDTESYKEFGDGSYYLSRAAMEYYWRHYLGDADGLDPDASPLRAEDLSSSPPALVITAECDPLRDEGEAYAARLRDAGVDVVLERAPGMFHGFFSLAAALEPAREARDRAFAALRTQLGRLRTPTMERTA